MSERDASEWSRQIPPFSPPIFQLRPCAMRGLAITPFFFIRTGFEGSERFAVHASQTGVERKVKKRDAFSSERGGPAQ